jgi:hypothetical protein
MKMIPVETMRAKVNVPFRSVKPINENPAATGRGNLVARRRCIQEEEQMKRINIGRVILGGFVAAIVISVVAGYLPGVILDTDLQAWHRSLGSLYTPPDQPVQILLFSLISLVFGITGVWIYAAVRPRYSAGISAALLAGFVLWLSGWFPAALGHIALGDYPQYRLTIVPCACGFIGALLATLAGAAIYKE